MPRRRLVGSEVKEARCKFAHFDEKYLWDSSARSYRTLRDGSFEDAFPGTSCLATISLSLYDKSHSPIEASQNCLSDYGRRPRAAYPAARRFGAETPIRRHGQAGVGTATGISFFAIFCLCKKPLNPHPHHRPNKETKTSLNSVVPNRISVAPGSTSIRPALCAT
jgi:hypothetical protein